MAEFASSGVGTAGLSLGIIGTSLAALGGGAGGILGNLFGGNAQSMYTDQLQAKVAELTAEKYSNQVGVEVYKAAREWDNKLSTSIAAINAEIADMRVNNAQTQGLINQVASTANAGIANLTTALSCLQSTVAGITKTVVPNTSVCPGWGAVTITPATTTTAAAS